MEATNPVITFSRIIGSAPEGLLPVEPVGVCPGAVLAAQIDAAGGHVGGIDLDVYDLSIESCEACGDFPMRVLAPGPSWGDGLWCERCLDLAADDRAMGVA